MGSLFRSEEMTLCQLFLQSEAAYSCVAELGELGLVQFRDLNPDVNAFDRKFVNEVRRCDEMERKLRFLEKEIKNDDITVLDLDGHFEAPQPREMIDLEATFEKLENELMAINKNSEALNKTYLELIEMKHILLKTQAFLDEQEHSQADTNSMQKSLVAHEQHEPQGIPAQLGFVSGVILRERLPSFERMLWRVCRGNAFLRRTEILTPLEDLVTHAQVYKSVFIIFFQGDQLKAKVKKICEGFRATLYPCPETPSERTELSKGVMRRIEDLTIVMKRTQEHRHRVLFAASKNINNWFVRLRKMKAIYHTLNLFNLDVTQKCLIAECWCAVCDLDKNQLALHRGTEHSGSSVPSILNRMQTKETPPTYNRTNKFTRGFQNIVDAYGVAGYGEVNPTPFLIITFPFLFAVMFGDFGHGLIMASFALWMVLREKALAAEKSTDEIWNTFFHGRYIILLMGTFSIYTGIIYNDCYSKSFNIFGSSWMAPPINNATQQYDDPTQLIPETSFYGTPYPFGIDPVWQHASNSITFSNSYKMKLSIILGVSQMVFGVVLSLANHIRFRSMLNILCEFIPQLIFLLAIFGYLVIMVFTKWIIYDMTDSSCAPSLLIMLINMFLFTYPDVACSPSNIYHGQQIVQTVFVISAVICIPWMLLIKPFILRHRWMKRNPHVANVVSNSTPATMEEGISSNHKASSSNKGKESEEEFDFGEIFIHQAIHTIEYCLGSISHTASYLRLWALSLAHAQLSEVLWTMVMNIGLSTEGYIGALILYFIFAVWASLTIAILLIMEGLSAFLHALRLHWVEFQSKFYAGDGYSFDPFSFDVILENAAAADA